MLSILSKFSKTVPASSQAPTSRRTKLEVENLENRLVPAYMNGSGDVIIQATNGNDTVHVNYENIVGTDGHVFRYITVNQNGFKQWFQAPDVEYGGDIFFYGYNGNDYFANNTYVRSHAYGMSGNDTLVGGFGNDTLDGGEGNDYLYGRHGHDTMYAGADYYYNWNVLDGGEGNDTMYGGFGADYMYGGNGNDKMYGGYGNDSLYGQGGYDILYGEAGNDLLDGGDDGISDYLHGGTGNDRFQIDWVWTGSYWGNRDYPADYAYGDSFYG